MTNQVLIVGASTRTAAFSACGQGWNLTALTTSPIETWARSSPCLRHRPPTAWRDWELPRGNSSHGPWIYTGPIENHPDLVRVSRAASARSATQPEILRAVRNPLHLTDVLRRHGLPSPDVRGSPYGLPRDATWLEKPIASGGGRLIQPLEQVRASLSEPTYFQKRIAGSSFSGLFIASQGEASLIGVTRQLIGTPGSPFAYCGSIGPACISEGLKAQPRRDGPGSCLGVALMGLFGVDYILSDDEAWAVEVNPRYTASVEVLELALRRSLLAEQLRACDGQSLEPNRLRESRCALPALRVVGKAIIYASQSLVTPDIPVDDAWRA